MKFLIRDDDTCAFTDPEELEFCYKDIWGIVPVNLSITPFRIPGYDKTLKKEYYGKMDILPLEKNKALVSFLREKLKKGHIDIALHGYHHLSVNGLPEYVIGKNLYQKTKKGKEYLEKLLNCSIITFVPPNNAISKKGLEAIIKNNLNLIGLPSFIRPNCRPIRIKNFWFYLKSKYYSLFYNARYPYVIDFGDHKEVSYYPVTPSQTIDFLLKGFEFCEKVRGIFIFSVHYHAFNRRLKSGELIKNVVNMFIEKAYNSPKVKFLTYRELWNS